MCELEENKLWNRTMLGLTTLLHAASDTLPTPLNLACWRCRVDNCWSLCNSPSSTTFHILNVCPVALKQGKFTCRHACDSILLKLLEGLAPHLMGKGRLLGDIGGFRVMDNPPLPQLFHWTSWTPFKLSPTLFC